MWRTHLLLLGGVVGAYALTAVLAQHSLYPQLPPRTYPQLPPLSITLFLFLDSSGLVGGLFHALAFSLLNLPLLTSTSTKPGMTFVPSLVALFIVTLASVWFWVASIGHGFRYQGRGYVLLLATANFVTLALLIAGATYLWYIYGPQPIAARGALVWFNAALYLAVLLVLFPYFGEVP